MRLLFALVTIVVVSSCHAQLWNSIQDKVGSLVNGNDGDEIELNANDGSKREIDTSEVVNADKEQAESKPVSTSIRISLFQVLNFFLATALTLDVLGALVIRSELGDVLLYFLHIAATICSKSRNCSSVSSTY